MSYALLDWSIYREKYLVHPDGWKLYFSGGIQAPWQYRIGVWIVVRWLNRWFHLKPYDALTLMDVVCLGLSLWIVLRILRNSEGYKAASATTRWLAIAGVLFLAEYYLVWGHWFQSAETIPSILFVTLSVALVCGEMVRSRLLACFLLLCLGWVQGFIRADVAVVLHAGFFLAILFNRQAAIPLGRAWQAVTSLLAALAAGCVQLYLMVLRFPNAKYGPEGVIQLVANVHPEMWLTMLLALLPFWCLLGLIFRKRTRPGPVTVMLLVSSLLYLALWATVGLLDEVRIFLPFAFALMPATALAFIGLVPTTGATGNQTVPVTANPVAE
ncbi:MAG: hypothetical protein ABI076_12905 [Acidobacteriaceae bacterium]